MLKVPVLFRGRSKKIKAVPFTVTEWRGCGKNNHSTGEGGTKKVQNETN